MIALCVARVSASGGIDVMVRDEADQSDFHLDSWETLSPVSLWWSPDGEFLAEEQGGQTRIWRVATRELANNLAGVCLGFDRLGALWLLSGDKLRRSILPYDSADIMDDGVVGACAAPIAAWIRASDHGALEACCTSHSPTPIPLLIKGRHRIKTDDEGQIYVSAESSLFGQTRIQIARIDPIHAMHEVLVDTPVALSLGRIEIPWVPWRNGQVLLLKNDSRRRRELHLTCAPSRRTQRISPPGFRVRDFAAHPGTEWIGVVGEDAEAAAFASFVMIQRHIRRWRFRKEGMANGSPAFDQSGTTVIKPSADSPAPMALKSYRLEIQAPPRSRPARTTLVRKTEVRFNNYERYVLCIGQLGAAAFRYRRSNFFQHALWEIAKDVARETGAKPVHLDAPLAASRPISFTDCVSWLSRCLSQGPVGPEAISVVSGSLGAACALRASTGVQLAGQILVAPVYSPWACGLHWPEFLGPEDAWDPVSLGRTSKSPTLVVHGVRDEVSPSHTSFRFTSQDDTSVERKLIQFADEGHIFADPASWRETVSQARNFASRNLRRA